MNRREMTAMTSLKRPEKWCSEHAEDCTSVSMKDERGAALILVMVILVMLTFIGLAALSTSSTELFLSANYRQAREAFETSEGRMDAALVDTANFDLSRFAGAGTSANLAAFAPDTDPSSHGTVSASGTVTFIATGPVQANTGFSGVLGNSTKANYFVLDTTGTGSLGASSRQELVLSKIVPGG
jgi:Tfp pilus assembly protein PilX